MVKKKILVAPLHWGLGHATRCIPIIKALEENGFTPIIASDGGALLLLQKEFPHLTHYEMPSYNIRYSKNGHFFLLKMVKGANRLLSTIKKEQRFTQALIEKEGISGVISDNRMGVFSEQVPSVFITHQLKVLSGGATYISTKLHQHYIRKFNACWIPDVAETPNLSGKMSHLNSGVFTIPITYMGPLSRFETAEHAVTYDLLILLSGPEPQRELLEKKMLQTLAHSSKKIALVRGVVEAESTQTQVGNFTVYNFVSGKALETLILKSKLIVSRSGYTTIMDLAKLKKKAFFIPTPGQFEQVYLAKRLHKQKIAPFCHQHEFEEHLLTQAKNYHGLGIFSTSSPDFNRLFSLF